MPSPLPATTRQIRLAERPDGAPRPENFALEPAAALAPPRPGEVALRLLWLSLDPYMRGRMSAASSYVAPFDVGATLEGGAVAEVVDSQHDGFKPGDLVSAMLPWAEHAVIPGAALTRLPAGTGLPPQAWLGVLGMPGLTAWVGLTKIAKAQEGQTVVVSAATGAVGSLAAQLARRRGLRVIGVAGGAAKCARAVAEYGCHACLDHRAAPDARTLSREIAETAPNGVDIYFENVGGKTLEAVLPRMNTGGRIALCGMIAWYSDISGAPPAPAVWSPILVKRLRVEGFIVTDHWADYPTFLADVQPLVAAGRIAWRESIAEGLDAAPQAFISLLEGGNDGKQLVRLGGSAG